MSMAYPSLIAGPADRASVCRRAIDPTEVERELDGVAVVLIAHEACYVLWREESKARRDSSI